MAYFLDATRCMEKNLNTINSTPKSCSVGILFLRVFIGAVMLLHIVGKMQTYDNLVLTYNSFLGLNSATSLILSIVVEGLLAALIVMGTAIRLSAMLMIVATLISLIEAMLTGSLNMMDAKVDFLYLGIYLTLVISGGGIYALGVPDRDYKYGIKR